MAVTFILGRAGSGKTHHCLQAVLSELGRRGEDRRLVLLVPEQASFQMERALATRAPRGGYWRAEILSFSRLASRVFDQTGLSPVVVGPEARALALRRVVSQAGASVRVLRKATRTSGFYSRLSRLIEELLAEDVSPAALRAAAEELSDPQSAREVAEIAHLYADYLAWLGPQRVDGAGRLAALRQRLARLDWLADASVWVDGFAGFTGQELATLAELARLARDVSITLLVDPAAPAVRQPRQLPDPLGLFHRTEDTYQRLLRLFTDAAVEVRPPIELRPVPLPRFAESPTLARLEAGLATPIGVLPESPASPLSVADVNLCECPTHRDELRAAARWIRTRIADSGGQLRFRDFAVIARDLEPFSHLVAEVFEEYGIPYFLDRRRPMRAHPLTRLLPTLLEVVLTDWEVEPVVRLLRTRLVPLSADQAEQVENLIVRGVVRGAAAWRQPTWELEQAGKSVDAFAPERASLVAAIEPLAAKATGTVAVTGAEWAAVLHGVLERLEVRRRVESWIAEARKERRWESVETHRLAWGALCSTLEDLHDLLGDTPFAAAEVAAILGSALSELTLGMAPPTVDQVLVSSIERSRHPDIRHAWVFAFNEGVFPARPAEDLLLSTSQREELLAAGLPGPGSHRDDVLAERLLAYIAFTRPSGGLTISYATVADDGSELLPSPLLAEVTRALPGLGVVRVSEHTPPVNVVELAGGYLEVRQDDRRQRELRRYERLCEQVGAMPAQAGHLNWLLRGLRYGNEPQPVGNYRRPPASAGELAWDGSPSEVETYLQCPFKHFASFGLRLDAERRPRPLRWDLGSVAHEILADVTRRAMREPGGVRAVTDPRWQELLDAAVGGFWRRQPADQTQRRPDLVFMAEVLVGLLRDLVAAHAARWRRGQFEPLCCEKGFDPRGLDDSLRALVLTLPDRRRVGVHGKIDRVDACHDGGQTRVLVYDYKSSRVESPRGEFLTGSGLQLFVYLLALRQGLAGEPPVRPAGVFLAPLYPDLNVLGYQYAADADQPEQLMYMYRPRGLVDEQVARLLDDRLGPSPSPVAQLRLKKDGGFWTSSDVLSSDELNQRIELAASTLRLAAQGICQGCIDVSPLVENRRLACQVCEFQAVCRFDRAYNTPRVAAAVLPRLEGAERATDATGSVGVPPPGSAGVPPAGPEE
jgi:ATP-dependent helicase/nuclease subunit B